MNIFGKRIVLTEPLIRWVGIPVVALIPYYFTSHHDQDPGQFWTEYFISFLFTSVYWHGCAYIFYGYRRAFPAIEKTAIRTILTFFSLFIWMVIGGIPLKLLFGYTSLDSLVTWETYQDTLPISLLLGLIIGILYEATFFFEKWKETFRLNEQLKNQQIRTQFEVLQNQMSPHFLFNSLNTLTTLIAENQEIAITFTEKLSEVYRYILMHKEKELVSLKEELTFAENYVFLLRMRYPDNLTVNFSIPEDYTQKHIAPLTIQMLIENAIKHNIISRAKPLTIDVYVDNGNSIVVKNNLQVKKALEKSTKTGLTNIKKRYDYLGNRKIDIITTAKNYMVAIPLINLIEEKELREPVLA